EDGRWIDLWVTAIRFEPSGVAVTATPVAFDSSAGPLAAVAGAFSPKTIDEQVAIAWSRDGETTVAAICSFDAALVPTVHERYLSSTQLSFSRSVALAAGDVNMNGSDEIVLSVVGQGGGS